ncbi:hypothetical protein AWB80_07763 [Caballeronia pedi]|uniref:Uncharacterized protein n=1 Tax=Caballeronia pedi TaxID=1777141 RepID=A0A158DZA3_9BURK|nr:hypothetical protein AWB80_07763 [Caballeronia pedi]
MLIPTEIDIAGIPKQAKDGAQTRLGGLAGYVHLGDRSAAHVRVPSDTHQFFRDLAGRQNAIDTAQCNRRVRHAVVLR